MSWGWWMPIGGALVENPKFPVFKVLEPAERVQALALLPPHPHYLLNQLLAL